MPPPAKRTSVLSDARNINTCLVPSTAMTRLPVGLNVRPCGACKPVASTVAMPDVGLERATDTILLLPVSEMMIAPVVGCIARPEGCFKAVERPVMDTVVMFVVDPSALASLTRTRL